MSLMAAIVAGDPDNLRDFSDPKASASNFTYPGLASLSRAAFIGNGGSQHPANVGFFPGISTLGVSGVILRFNPCGVNTPHVHPRATQTQYLVKGKLLVGFVDTAGNYYANIANAGDVFVFPRGLIHFEQNIGDEEAVGLALFNAELPGASFMNEAYQKIPLSPLATTFGAAHTRVKEVLYTDSRQISLDQGCLSAKRSGNFESFVSDLLDNRIT